MNARNRYCWLKSGVGLLIVSLSALPIVVAGCGGGGGGGGVSVSLMGRFLPQAPSALIGMARDAEFVCGEPSVQDLTAGQSIVIGTLTISNDEDYLYVVFNTDAKVGYGFLCVGSGGIEDIDAVDAVLAEAVVRRSPQFAEGRDFKRRIKLLLREFGKYADRYGRWGCHQALAAGSFGTDCPEVIFLYPAVKKILKGVNFRVLKIAEKSAPAVFDSVSRPAALGQEEQGS